MNTGTLLTRIRLEQRSLIDINKKLYELEHLLPAPAPEQFIKTAKSAALLSERSTAQLRNFLFTVCGGMPQDYYLQAAEMQGIRLNVDDDILSVRLPALLLKKTRTEGFKFLQPAIHAALKQYAEQQNLPHFCECTICIEHIYDRCLPIKAVRDYDNLEMKEVLDIIALYCIPEIVSEDSSTTPRSVEDFLDNIEDERLYRLLREVDSQTLQMLFLKSLGYTAKEIEQRIGMPESMVHNRISRLRKKYKKDL